MSQHRAKWRAADAWDCSPHRCASEHVRQGFIGGYCDVALGRKGCTPAVAPSEYWGWQYSPAEGQVAGQQWLQGYPMGANAARADGMSYKVASLNIPSKEQYAMSAQAYTGGMQNEYQQIDTRPIGTGAADTIDGTIEFAPREYEQDAVEEEATTTNDVFLDGVDSFQPPRGPENITIEPSKGLKVQTITSDVSKKPATTRATVRTTLKSAKGEGKAAAVKQTASPVKVKSPSPVKATLPKTAVKAPVAKTPLVKSATKAATATVNKATAAVKSVGEVVPEFKLEPNDEVFGFGIE